MTEKIPKLVRDKWYKMRREDRAREWDNVEAFAEWFKREAGERVDGLALRRFDPGKPWGPDNCYLQRLNTEELGPSEDVIKWNKTVNVFRRAAGLPLFKEE